MRYDDFLLEYIDELKPTLDWLFYNFEDLRREIYWMNEQGRFLKDYSIKGIGRPSSYQNDVENQIISLSTCLTIIRSIEQTIYSLRSDNFDIFVKYYQDKLPLKAIARQCGISERTIMRRINYIYQYALLGLEEDEITIYNLYWFREAFGFEKNRKKVC